MGQLDRNRAAAPVQNNNIKLPSGLCTCVIGDPYGGPKKLAIQKLSALEAILEPCDSFRPQQFVYTTVELAEGPSMSLSGVVMSVSPAGLIVRWEHATPKDADRVGRVLADYARSMSERRAEAKKRSAAARKSSEAVAKSDAAPIAEVDNPRTAASPSSSSIPSDSDAIRPRSGSDEDTAVVSDDLVSQQGVAKRPGSFRGSASAGKRDAASIAAEFPKTGSASLRSPRKRIVVADTVRVPESARASTSSTELTTPPASPSSESGSAEFDAGGSCVPPAVDAKPADASDPSAKSTPPGARPSPTSRARRAAASVSSSTPKIVKVGDRVDVDATIRHQAKTIRSADLASRVDTVQVLNLSTIRELIKAAVDEVVTLLGPSIAETERKRLLSEAEEEFKEKVKAFQAEKAGLEAQAQNLEAQLSKARAVLEEERQRVVSSNQFTVSDTGMLELAKTFDRVLERAVTSGRVTPDIESDLRTIVDKLLDDERERIREQVEQAQNDKIQLLEKKVSRLASSLEDTAKERDRARQHAHSLELSGFIPRGNVMTAGLAADDPDKERKLSLLKEILEFNRDIRDQLQGRTPEANVRAASTAGIAPSLVEQRAAQVSALPEVTIAAPASEVLLDDTSAAERRDRVPRVELTEGASDTESSIPSTLVSDGISVELSTNSSSPSSDVDWPSNEESTRYSDAANREDHEDSTARGQDSDEVEAEYDAEHEDEHEDDEDRIPVLAEGGEEEIDPDDLPWSPAAASHAKSVAFRRLG
jgi:DNA-binding ferritin-like protein (Dps family)